MSSKAGRSQTIKHSYTKLFILAAALLIVAALIAAITLVQLGVFKGIPTADGGNNNKNNNTDTGSLSPSDPGDNGNGSTESQTDDDSDQGGAAREYINCAKAQLTETNPLLIVNAEHPFDPKKAVALVTIYGAKPVDGGKNPRPFTAHNQINADTLTAFQLLNGALDVYYGEDAAISILSAYTMLKSQKIESFDIGLDGAQCSDKNLDEPSLSIHATGYAADIRYYKGNKSLDDPAHAEITAKLLSLCPTFGLIQERVVDGNFVSGAAASRDHWHFRYVGVPHALYMTKNSLSFDGYMDALRKTNYNKSSRLSVAASDGTVYEMYFVKAEESGETRVPVPAGSNYEIAGNGVDGFIVTLTYPASA